MNNNIIATLKEIERLLNEQQFITALNLSELLVVNNQTSIEAHISYANLCRMAYVDDIYTEIDNDRLIVQSFIHYKQAMQIHSYLIRQCEGLYELALSQRDEIQIHITHQRWMDMKREFTNIVNMYGSGITPFEAMHKMCTLRFGNGEYNIAHCISAISNIRDEDMTIDVIQKSSMDW